MLAHITRRLLADSLKQKSSHGTALFRPKLFVRCLSQQTPVNTVIMFVPEQEVWIVERMGKFHRLLKPGINILIPIMDRVRYVQCLKEIPIEINDKTVITADSVTLGIDSVVFLKINDPYLASYGVEDPEYAISQLAQTTMRSVLGKMSLEDVLLEKENVNENIIKSINKASEAWGITCLRYEIRNIQLPPSIQEAMKMQAEAQRRSRATILESEGVKTADINVAEGKRAAKIIESEAEKVEMINKANGEATALCIIAEARAKSIEIIANVLRNQGGSHAAAFSIAEQYVSAFEKLAKTSNTLIVPDNVCDISRVVSKALSIHENVSGNLQSVVANNSNEAKRIV